MAGGVGGRFRSLRRRVLVALVAATSLLLLALAGAWTALQFQGPRAALLRSLTSRLEARTGIHATAADFTVDLSSGLIELRDVRLRVADPAAPPFLVVPRARARVHWPTLLSGTPVLSNAVAEEPRFDFDAPLPVGKGRGERTGPIDLGIEVRDARVTGGTATASRLPASFRGWAEAAHVARIETRGALRGGRIVVESATGTLTLESATRPPLVAEVRAAGTIELDGRVTVDSLDVEGDGLAVRGSARTAGDTHEATLAIELDAGKRFPDLTPGGGLRADGTVTVVTPPGERANWRGSVKADATDFPAILLEPWLDPLLGSSFDASGTHLRGRTSVEFDLLDAQSLAEVEIRHLAGKVDATWARGESVLAHAALDVSGTPGATDALHLRFDAEVLPAEAGSRRASGELDLRTTAPLADTRFDGVRIRLDEPAPRASAERLGFRADVLRDAVPEGRYRATVDLDGTLKALGAHADLRWEIAGETLATLLAQATPAARGGGTDARMSLALWPDRPGVRRAEAEAHLPPEDLARGTLVRRASARVELADAAAEIETVSRLVALVLPPSIAPGVLERLKQVETAGIAGALTFEAEAQGRLDALETEAHGSWRPAPDERLAFEAEGSASVLDPLRRSTGSASVDLEAFRLSRILRAADAFTGADAESHGLEARIDAGLHATLAQDGLSGDVEVSTGEFELPGVAVLRHVRVVARSDGHTIDWSTIECGVETALAPEMAGPVRSSLRGSGRTMAAWPPGPAEFRLGGVSSFAGLEQWSVNVFLEGGTLRVDPLEVGHEGEPASFRASIPLGSLGPWSRALESAGLPADRGPLVLAFERFEVGPWIAMADPEGVYPPVAARISGDLTLDPERPLDAAGTVAVDGFVLTLEEGPIGLVEGPRFEIGGGRVVLAETQLHARAPWFETPTEADVSAVVDLDRDWGTGDPWRDLVRDVDLKWHGLVPSSLAQLWVPGKGTGTVAVDLTAKGPPESLTVRVTLAGPSAEFRPEISIPTQITEPEGTVLLEGGVVRIEDTVARINGGLCDFKGTIGRKDGVQIDATCSGVRYRLQYGVTVGLGGRLTLRWPWTGRRLLKGDVVVERAVLRRDVDLDRELLRALLEPELGVGAEAAGEPIELDLSVTTDEGLQIKNNLADLHAQWGHVEVGGTLDRPLLTGRVDIDPGGRLVLPGQTLRIDQGSLSWSAESPSEPRIQLETTSSLVDPTIQQSWRSDWYDMGQLGPGQGGPLDFASQQQAATSEFVSALSTGVLTHYQSRLAGTVTRGIGQTQISYEPLPLFGETESQARFTFSQDLASYMTFIASSDPRQAEAQTYIVDLHAVRAAPSLQGQLFTNDEKNAGVTLQQKLRLGRGSQLEDTGPRLRTMVVEAPETVKARKVRNAVEYRKGDPFAAGAGLDVEVDAAEALRRQGFPTADVRARVEPVNDEKVDVHVLVEPGPRVRFEFVGEKLPRAARQAVIARYRPSVDNTPESFEGMLAETRRALRSLGFVEPEVTIEVLPPPADEPETRALRIGSTGGRKIEPGPPVFEGVPSDVAGVLASLFEGLLGRVELAAGLEQADDFVIESLRTLGYPQPRVVSRTLSEDGHELRVVLDPGLREIVAAIEIEGVDEADQAASREALGIAAGDPARRDLIARGATAIEARLRERGHALANVQYELEPRGDRPEERLLRYRAELGPAYRIDAVHYEGMRGSKPKWVAKVAGIEAGDPLRQDLLSDARGKLYRTGVFRRIRVDLDPPIERQAETAAGDLAQGVPGSASRPLGSTVTFRVEEAPRYQVSYGGRWESSKGVGVVMDFVDRNSLGRGQISGARAVYSQDLQSLRLFHAIPHVWGTRKRLELFLEGSREIQDLAVLERAIDSWVQLTSPLTPRTETRVYVRLHEVKLSQVEPDPNAAPLDERTASPQVGWQIVYDTSTRPLGETRRGVFAGLDLSFAHESLGSDITGAGVFNQLKFFVPLSPGKNPAFSWAQSWRTSLVLAQDDSVPFADRLFLGGEYSVRGYPTDSLGPLDADGVAIGGEFLFVVNEELQARLYDSLTGLAFFDAGNVWERTQDIESELFHSWGLGLRYVSPVGPLRLDVGFPLDRRPDDPEYTVYFGFGNVF